MICAQPTNCQPSEIARLCPAKDTGSEVTLNAPPPKGLLATSRRRPRLLPVIGLNVSLPGSMPKFFELDVADGVTPALPHVRHVDFGVLVETDDAPVRDTFRRGLDRRNLPD